MHIQTKQITFNVTINTYACHNFRHLEYCQPMGSLYCSQERPPQDHDNGCNTRDFRCTSFRSHSHDLHNCRYCNYKASNLWPQGPKLPYWTPRSFKMRNKIMIKVLFLWSSKSRTQSWSLYPSRWSLDWNIIFSAPAKSLLVLDQPQGLKASNQSPRNQVVKTDHLLLRIMHLRKFNEHCLHFILLPCLLQTIILVKCLIHVSEDQQPPPSSAMTKWYDSDEDSYGSLWPKDNKYFCKMPPTIRLEEKFLCRFQNDTKWLPYWAIIKICIDLQYEFNILTQARRTANLKGKARDGQHCYIKQDQCHRELLECILHQWCTLAYVEQDKGLVPLRVKDSSNEQQENYHELKNHYQRIADNILLAIIADKNICIIVIALIITLNHGKLILKSLQVLLRQSLMSSWQKLVSPAVLVRAYLPRIL